jgi:hypothetical protein
MIDHLNSFCNIFLSLTIFILLQQIIDFYVKTHYNNNRTLKKHCVKGAIAQLVEHCNGIAGAIGSSPFSSIKTKKSLI